jgi:hypothetical protein
MIVTRVGPLSCARIAGLLYGIIGLIAGAVVSLISLAGGFAASNSDGAGIAAVVGVGAIVALPLLYGGLGFVMALIASWLYNALAGLVGGIEIDVR